MRLVIHFIILTSAGYCADFSTYVGEPNQNQAQSVIGAVATDSEGDTYTTGSNALVTKLDPAGKILFTATFGAGGGYSSGYSMALDSSGNIWVGGQTTAANIPLVNPLQSSVVSSGSGFLVKMAPDGTILYSSYFGGTLGASAVNGVATDQGGNVYLTGFTEASDFPTTSGLPAMPVQGGNAPVYGLFAAKLDSTGQKVLYSTVVAGAANCAFCSPVPKTVGAGIAVDRSGNALVAGTSNTDLAGIPGGTSGSGGAFVFKISAAGNQLVYFTYVGAAQNAAGSVAGSVAASITFGARPIAADASDNVYLTGYTTSSEFPATQGAYHTTYDAGGNPEAFAMKLNPAGITVWATFLGGTSSPNTAAGAISLDGSDNVWLTGTNGTVSTQYAGFVAELSPDGTNLRYLAQFPQASVGQDIAVDPSGAVHFAGPIGLVSAITPTQAARRVLSIVNAGSGQFSGTMAPGEIVSLYGIGLGPATPMVATPQGGFFPTSLGGVTVLVDSTPIPLLYVSDSQINAEIPAPLNGVENGLADVRVVNATATLPDFRAGLATSVFGAFYSGGAYLAATNQDGTVNSEGKPAKAGSYVSLWTTGFGSPGVAMNGGIATAANNYCSDCQVTFITYNFGATETVQYAGPSPGLIDGVMQINVMIPAQTRSTSQTPQLQVYLNRPGATGPMFLGFVWVSE